MLGLFELLQHRHAVHSLESQSTGERGHSLVAPQMQGMGRQQDCFPRRSSGIQPGLDLDDVKRGDGLQKHLGPGPIDSLHVLVMVGQPVVEALPGLDEFGGRGPELRLAGDRQGWLVEQEFEIVQHYPARGHDAVPERAEIFRRDPGPVQRVLHELDDRAQIVQLVDVGNRGFCWQDLDGLALAVVAQCGFEGYVLRFEEPTPGFGPTEEPDPGQEFAVDVKFEPAFVAIDGVFAAGRVFVVFDRIVEGLSHAVGDVLQRAVIPVEKRCAALSRYILLVECVAWQPVVALLLVGVSGWIRYRIVLRR